MQPDLLFQHLKLKHCLTEAECDDWKTKKKIISITGKSRWLLLAFEEIYMKLLYANERAFLNGDSLLLLWDGCRYCNL